MMRDIVKSNMNAKRYSCMHCNFQDSSALLDRLINFTTAFILLLLFSPFMFLISMVILLFDGFPIFYKGKRLGKNGNLFTMYKFRTLFVGAEEKIGI